MREKIFIEDSERKGKLIDLFSIWVPTQIGILGLLYGAIIVSFNISFIQSILAAIIGSLSFILVGYLSIAGKIGKTTMFNLSRAVFGVKGNYIPTLCAWINLVGWMCVNVITGTLTLMSLLNIFSIPNNSFSMILSLIILSFLISICALISQEALVKLQTFFTYIFGILTIIILFFISTKIDFNKLIKMENGSWINNFLPAVSIIVAGTGISWAIAAADYSVYQNPKNSNLSIILITTLAGFIPLFVLMFIGILITTTSPNFLNATNPIDIIGEQLPKWMTIPYLITALVGLIAPSVISLRSAKVNLLTLGIKVNDLVAIIIHIIIMLFIGIYVLFVSNEFLSVFQSFLGLMGIPLSAWCSVFMIDYIMIRKKYGYKEELMIENNSNNYFNIKGITSWIIGVIIGFLFTNSYFFNGPFAHGIFKDNSLGIFITFFVSFISYFVLNINKKENI